MAHGEAACMAFVFICLFLPTRPIPARIRKRKIEHRKLTPEEGERGHDGT